MKSFKKLHLFWYNLYFAKRKFKIQYLIFDIESFIPWNGWWWVLNSSIITSNQYSLCIDFMTFWQILNKNEKEGVNAHHFYAYANACFCERKKGHLGRVHSDLQLICSFDSKRSVVGDDGNGIFRERQNSYIFILSTV